MDHQSKLLWRKCEVKFCIPLEQLFFRFRAFSRHFYPKRLTVFHTLMAVATSTSGAVWCLFGSVFCPRTLQHADQGNWTNDLSINKTLTVPPWATAHVLLGRNSPVCVLQSFPRVRVQVATAPVWSECSLVELWHWHQVTRFGSQFIPAVQEGVRSLHNKLGEKNTIFFNRSVIAARELFHVGPGNKQFERCVFVCVCCDSNWRSNIQTPGPGQIAPWL